MKRKWLKSNSDLFVFAAGSPKALARLERIRAKGRKHFIWTRGVLGWGVTVAVLLGLSRFYARYGWRQPPHGDLALIVADFILMLVLWMTAGYFFGARLWVKMGVERSAETGAETGSEKAGN